MKCESNPEYGARIERGIIIEISGGNYTVKSYDRLGLIFEKLKNKTGYVPPDIAVGDKVCFYAFDDGKGTMIEKL